MKKNKNSQERVGARKKNVQTKDKEKTREDLEKESLVKKYLEIETKGTKKGKDKLPSFVFYYGWGMVIMNLGQMLISYLEFQSLLEKFGEELDPNYIPIIEISGVHLGLALIFIVGIIFKHHKIVLVYFNLLLGFMALRYILSYFGVFQAPEVELLSFVGVPIVFIVPQLICIIMILRKLRES